MKYLIVNADDFGMSLIFNREILGLVEQRLVSSTTVMIKRVSEEQRVQVEELKSKAAKRDVSVGLHLEFEGADYLSEVKAQVALFKSWFGQSPSHLDIHKASSFPASFEIVAKYCLENSIPCRNHLGRIGAVRTTDNPAFFGSKLEFEAIDVWLKGLKDGEVSEILFHPGAYDPECKSSLNKQREQDVVHIKMLSEKLAGYGITLVSFSQAIGPKV